MEILFFLIEMSFYNHQKQFSVSRILTSFSNGTVFFYGSNKKSKYVCRAPTKPTKYLRIRAGLTAG